MVSTSGRRWPHRGAGSSGMIRQLTNADPVRFTSEGCWMNLHERSVVDVS